MKPQWEPGDFEITTTPDGARVAVNPHLRVTVLPHTHPKCSACGKPKTREIDKHRVFYQREIPLNRPGMAATSVLVAQLNDARVYCTPNPDGSVSIVLTDKRLAM